MTISSRNFLGTERGLREVRGMRKLGWMGRVRNRLCCDMNGRRRIIKVRIYKLDSVKVILGSFSLKLANSAYDGV